MTLLKFSGITKWFGSFVANDDISLSLDTGEVLALLGENGAGKTTLMNILFGHYLADEGSIEVDGETLTPGSTDAALNAGIGMVHQHFTLGDNLTVLENIVLGAESLWSPRQSTRAARQKVLRIAGEFGLDVDPDARVAGLTVGERQRVEILKALYRDARILIMDEPTAVLTPQETERLFETLKGMTAKGLAIIFISHKLHEILSVSDRVAVLRRGKLVGEVDTSSADREMLAEMMVGRAVVRPKARPMTAGGPVFELTEVDVAGTDNRAGLASATLTVHAHEIVGIAGVAGNGQAILADLACGLRKPDKGTVHIGGGSVTKFSPAHFISRGVARIPEDRHSRGVVVDMPVWENLISEDRRDPPISRFSLLIDRKVAIARAEQQIETFDIRCKGPAQETRLLSGGNMQKLILARELSTEPAFILANQPVRGLDEGAIAYVHEQLLAARTRGAGILMISEDLDEILSLADRVAVMHHGTLTPTFDPKQVDVRDIGLMMAGHGADVSAGPGEAESHAH